MDFLKKFKARNILCVPVILGAVWSCGEVLNTDDYDIKRIEATPTMALPLAYGDLSIQDVLSKADSDHIKVYPDGLVYLEYNETLKTQAIKELIEIPDKNNITRTLAVPAGVMPPVPSDINSTQINQTIFFDITPEQLTEVLFREGQILYNLNMTPANAGFRYAVHVSIPEFVLAGVPFSRELPPAGPSISLAGYTYTTPTPNRITIVFTLVIKQNPNPVTIPPGTTVTADLSFRGMRYAYAKGFFGDQIADVPEENIDINAFGNSLTNGVTVSFAQPKLEFSVTSSVGVPTKVYFSSLEARKAGSSLPIQINPASPITINSPATLGAEGTTLVTVNNVNALLNFAPTQMHYKLTTRINENLTSGSNFVSDTSSLRVKMHIEVPLYGHASNIKLADTLEIDLTDADQSSIESAALKVKTINEIPLEASIQFYLTDRNYQVLDSLLAPNQKNIIKASQVNASGDLQTAATTDELITLDKTKLNKIFQAERLIIRARMNTTNSNGTFPDVKFKSQYKLNIKLGLQAKLKINVDL